MKNIIFISLFISSVLQLAAQVPTDTLQLEEADTVVVREDPVIINKTLIVEHVKVAKFYFSGNASIFQSLNYYSPCESCQSYVVKYRSSVTPIPSMGAGAELMYASGKITTTLFLNYFVQKEKFKYISENGNIYQALNSNKYGAIGLTGGYWAGRNNKNISFIISIGMIYSRLISARGLTIDYDDPSQTKPISEGIFRKNQFSVTVGSKIILLPASRLKLFLEPYYMGNITDSMVNPYMYLKLHNILGVKGGFIYSL